MVNDCKFVHVLRLIRPEASHDMTAEEEATVDEHFEYLKHALTEGRLGFAGRCLDGQFAIALFRAWQKTIQEIAYSAKLSWC
jgi:uncharacterized protein YciI